MDRGKGEQKGGEVVGVAGWITLTKICDVQAKGVMDRPPGGKE